MLLVCFTFVTLEKSVGQTNSSSSNSLSECIICTQVIPNCSDNEMIVLQTCSECAHCIPVLSSSGNLTCATDDDCPVGICSSSGTFKNYSCSNSICSQIFYFADPCQFQSSSSSGSLILLNKAFTGTWKSKISTCETSSSVSKNSEDSNCIICPQVIPKCSKGFFIVPQTCIECSHCEQCSQAFLQTIILKLCVKDHKLKGTVYITDTIENEDITSYKVISNKEINITTSNENTLNLILVDRNHIKASVNKKTFQLKRTSLSKACSSMITSSSGGNDCGSVGSCRGPNGLELLCPEGTFCSGLPAYGCYPPSCPVPICCSPDTRIRTTGIQKRIADILEGDLVLTDSEKPVRVIKVSRTEVKNHKILKVSLNDGIVLEISPGHPTSDGKLVKDLKIGDLIDGHIVIEVKQIPYNYKYTYDILPDSKTGNYYANGVLIGSTLAR